jgi:hypothetical protein
VALSYLNEGLWVDATVCSNKTVGETDETFGEAYGTVGRTYEVVGGIYEVVSGTYGAVGGTYEAVGGAYVVFGETYEAVGGASEVAGETAQDRDVLRKPLMGLGKLDGGVSRKSAARMRDVCRTQTHSSSFSAASAPGA